MELNKQTSLLDKAVFIPSPNFDHRPPSTTIDLLVIHNISLPAGCFTGNTVIEFFCNRLKEQQDIPFEHLATVRVSAHLFIRRDGSVIQFVPFHCRAWHAGQSSFKGKSACNDFSIGIELEGTDDIPYELVQYRQLAAVTKVLRQHYPAISLDNITGHSNIAPERKTDPGPSFDWQYFKQLLS